MSKFTLFKEVTAQEKRAKSQSYQAIRRERQEELMELAAEVDVIMDRRRNRKARMNQKSNPQISRRRGVMMSYPPDGYVSLKRAEKITGFRHVSLCRHLAAGSLPGQKFNDPKTGLLIWYISERTCQQLRERHEKGLDILPSVYLRSEIVHGKGTKHV